MEKLFQVPSERAQSLRGESEKEGERINRKNYFHMQLGEGSLCAGLARGSWKGPCCSPASPPLPRLSFQPHLPKGQSGWGQGCSGAWPCRAGPSPCSGQEGQTDRSPAGVPPNKHPPV